MNIIDRKEICACCGNEYTKLELLSWSSFSKSYLDGFSFDAPGIFIEECETCGYTGLDISKKNRTAIFWPTISKKIDIQDISQNREELASKFYKICVHNHDYINAFYALEEIISDYRIKAKYKEISKKEAKNKINKIMELSLLYFKYLYADETVSDKRELQVKEVDYLRQLNRFDEAMDKVVEIESEDKSLMKNIKYEELLLILHINKHKKCLI